MSESTPPTQEQVADLKARVFALVRACPPGRVTTYSSIGKALGYPRGARMIGWIMNESPEDVPAQRVINSKGELTGSWAFGSPERMQQLLADEGITFSDRGHVDLKRYGWDPSRDLDPAELELILNHATGLPATVSPRLLHLLRNDPASPLRPS